MATTRVPDSSRGYEPWAAEFISGRTHSTVGASTVREWAGALPHGASVLDLGCGHGVPVSEVLIADGFRLYGVDASPTLVAAFRERFPGVPVDCSAVEDSTFFNRTFDAVVSWGLMFLLSADTQAKVIAKVARALNPGGAFLFTSPEQACTWLDALSGRPSISLGRGAYERIIRGEGLRLHGERWDEGDNHYYLVSKPQC
jgi:2-polyprenyl-3-methyl-5-hydroxy-6-metoxy-1,4-benzoquinol methylase